MNIRGPLTEEIIKKLARGREIAYSGVVYTARDQAHKKLADLIKRKRKLPFDLKNQIIYYCGPNPARPGEVIGSCGPTTSGRMDEFTPLLLREGLKGMIGKGGRSPAVSQAVKKYKAVYFITYAGCGALLAQYVKAKRAVCFPELGAEAVFALETVDFPLIVEVI